MRTTIMLASALAATALAKPLAKRDVVVTQVDVVYQTDIVTVTAGQQQAAPSPAAVSSSSSHHHHHHHSSSVAPAAVPTTTPAAVAAPSPSTTQSPAAAETPVSSSSPAPSEAAPSYGGTSTATTYQSAVINHHNYHRANHSAPAIAWNQKMADIAMSIAKTCVYAHNVTAGGGGYGQNIAAGVGASDVSTTISDLFYNGEVSKYPQYGVAQPDMSGFEGWGHFSQIVWKDTQSVGCATWNCGSNLKNFGGNNGYFTVCNYYPPGNYGGEYGDNVLKPKGMNTITGDFNVNTGEIGKSYCSATGQPLN